MVTLGDREFRGFTAEELRENMMNTGKGPKNAYLSGKEDDQIRLKRVEQAKATYGRACLLKLLKGSKLTRKESQAAFCCKCMGLYADKVCDCEVYGCPMYQYMPYRSDRKRWVRKDRVKK